MVSKMVVTGDALAATAAGLEGLASTVAAVVGSRGGAGGALGSPAVGAEHSSASGDQRRRAVLAGEQMRAVAGLAQEAAAAVERVESELEAAARD